MLSRAAHPLQLPHPAAALDLTDEVASTTAWGMGDPLDVVLERIAASTTATTVELSIGARPVADPRALLEAHAERFSYLAHHTSPILARAELRPTEDRLATAAATLAALGITRYTVHPPHRRHVPTVAELDTWAWRWHDALADAGIAFRLETMYRPRLHDEALRTGGYHLDTADAVHRFCDQAVARGWDTPLLIDASHLHIGWAGGDWTEAAIDDLLGAGLSDHLHVSANDGRADHHTLVPHHHRVASWIAPHRHRFAIVVDEARRRARRDLTGLGVHQPLSKAGVSPSPGSAVTPVALSQPATRALEA